MADRLIHVDRNLAEPVAEIDGHAAQRLGVERDAVTLHPDQHRHQRHLRLVEGLAEAVALEVPLELAPEPLREIGVRGGIRRAALDFDLVHRNLLAPFAQQVGNRRHLDVE